MNYKAYFFFVLTLTALSGLINHLYEKSKPSSIQEQQQSADMGETYRPDFELPDLEGKIHKNSKWNGKVVVVNFWATWCPPCIKEIPVFVELQKQYGKKGLQFIGIAIDKPESIADFVDTLEINYPVLISQHEGVTISQDFGNHLGALPFTAVVNRKGIIVFRRPGEIDEKMAEKEILSLLK